jgi:hypothetical protein
MFVLEVLIFKLAKGWKRHKRGREIEGDREIDWERERGREGERERGREGERERGNWLKTDNLWKVVFDSKMLSF